MRAVALVSFAVVLSCANPARADHHHKEWFKYFAGEWTFEENVGGQTDKGTAVYSMESDNDNAMLVRFKASEGTSTELVGWRTDLKTMSCSGYGGGSVSYWHHDLKLKPKVAEGPSFGVVADGRGYEGTMTVKQIDDDHWEWHFKGKTDDGKELVGVGKFTRK